MKILSLKRLWSEYQEGHWNGDRDQWDETIPDHLWQLIGRRAS